MSRGSQPIWGDSPIVDNEVCERELVRVEEKRGTAKRKDGYPEVSQVQSPKPVSRRTASAASTTSGDVPCPTESEIVQERMRVNLSSECFKREGEC
jgi:hypothetical protein